MNIHQKKEDLTNNGFCVLEGHLSDALINDLNNAFGPLLDQYLATNADAPNRGPHRHFLAVPFNSSTFRKDFFFDTAVLDILKSALGERIVADQWGCDTPVFGSDYQQPHVDYQRPLFPESPDLLLPPYMMVVSFGLVDIDQQNGAIEIAPGTHVIQRETAHRLVKSGEIPLVSVTLKKGDVLIRHPWAIHRGTPNTTPFPRPLMTIRYVRSWYEDRSRDVSTIPLDLWNQLNADEQQLLRFPVEANK